mmetsp:Transcript_26358/g.39072  ORF Transcript_26358/g.39072 Transcript_26358/m.39072 type:complete len:280 (+) Transcript_26358:119-958(+)
MVSLSATDEKICHLPKESAENCLLHDISQNITVNKRNQIKCDPSEDLAINCGFPDRGRNDGCSIGNCNHTFAPTTVPPSKSPVFVSCESLKSVSSSVSTRRPLFKSALTRSKSKRCLASLSDEPLPNKRRCNPANVNYFPSSNEKKSRPLHVLSDGGKIISNIKEESKVNGEENDSWGHFIAPDSNCPPTCRSSVTERGYKYHMKESLYPCFLSRSKCPIVKSHRRFRSRENRIQKSPITDSTNVGTERIFYPSLEGKAMYPSLTSTVSVGKSLSEMCF